MIRIVSVEPSVGIYEEYVVGFMWVYNDRTERPTTIISRALHFFDFERWNFGKLFDDSVAQSILQTATLHTTCMVLLSYC